MADLKVIFYGNVDPKVRSNGIEYSLNDKMEELMKEKYRYYVNS